MKEELELTSRNKKDFLSTLPPETLIKIFSYLTEPIEIGLSNSLLPFSRPLLYKKVTIESLKQFKLFIRTLNENQFLGSLVTHLQIFIERPYDKNSYIPGGRITFSLLEIVNMLKSFSNVKIMEIDFCWLASILASKYTVASFLSTLKQLYLHQPFFASSNPYHPKHYQFFPFYPKLKLFGLYMHPAVLSEEEQLNEMVDRLNWFDDFQGLGKNDLDLKKVIEAVMDRKEIQNEVDFITSSTVVVDISGPIQGDILDPICLFKSIETLSLLDTLHSESTLELFDQLSNSNLAQQICMLRLKYLSTSYSPASPLNFSFYPTIIAFTNLTTLSICSHGFTDEIFQYLRDPLPLETLILDKEVSVSINQLTKILKPGIERISTLKRLILNIVAGKISPDRVVKKGPYFEYDDDELIATRHPGWILPKWIIGKFDERRLRCLIKLGKEMGVKISGTSVEAIGILEAWEDDRMLAEIIAREVFLNRNKNR